MKRIIIGILIFSAHTALAVDDWPMFHYDLALNGYSTSTAPDTNNILWIYDTNTAPIGSSPAIVEGKLYIGSQDGNLYCLDALDGTLLWTYPTGSDIQSSPAVAEGVVYFLSTDGICYAADAVSGANVWSATISPGPNGPGPWDWSSPAVHNGSVFIGSSLGTIYSLDAHNGAVNWSTFVGGSPDSPIAVANGKVYSGTHNFDYKSSTLVALDEVTGVLVWAYDYHFFHNRVIGMVNSNCAAIADGDDDGDLEVYLGVFNWNGTGPTAVCLDESTGAEIWAADINGNTTSTPAVHEGVVFIGSDDGSLYALDANNGDYIWSYPTGGQIWSSPAVTDGMVFFGSLDHTVYAVDEATGELVWKYFTGASRIIGSPAVAYGNLYVGNENGKIYAFSSQLISVDIDIKPQSCPNPLNVLSNGVLPIAILGAEDFDVEEIDPLSVLLSGVSPIRSDYEDVASPVLDREDDCECTTESGDGYPDMTLKFKAKDIANTLQVSDGDEVVLTLTGRLFDGTPIEGRDCIIIRAKQ